MHPELQDCIDTSRRARDLVLNIAKGSSEAQNRIIKRANAVASHNHNIVAAHAVNTRRLILLNEWGDNSGVPVSEHPTFQRPPSPKTIPAKAAAEPPRGRRGKRAPP